MTAKEFQFIIQIQDQEKLYLEFGTCNLVFFKKILSKMSL